MDKRILLTLALGAMSQVFTHAWEPKGDKIKTVWACLLYTSDAADD